MNSDERNEVAAAENSAAGENSDAQVTAQTSSDYDSEEKSSINMYSSELLNTVYVVLDAYSIHPTMRNSWNEEPEAVSEALKEYGEDSGDSPAAFGYSNSEYKPANVLGKIDF